MPYGQAWLARAIEALTAALDALPADPAGAWRGTTDLGVGAYANSNCSQSGDGGSSSCVLAAPSRRAA